MKKLERLACLYLTFLHAPGGLSFAALRRAIPQGWSGDAESARRKFERDKKELRRLGLELEYYPAGSVLPDGNLTQSDRYVPADPPRPNKLPGLPPEDAQALAALLLEALATQREHAPDRAALLESAALKLLYRNSEQLLEHHAPRLGLRRPQESGTAFLSQIHAALRRRRVLSLTYPEAEGSSSSRDVEPRGLIAHRGRWCLVAYCRRVQDVRSFYVDRMLELKMTADSFRPAPGFDLKQYSLHPLALRLHEPARIELRLAGGAEQIFADFTAGLREVRHVQIEREGDLVVVTTPNRRGLFQWILAHPGSIEALGPSGERERLEGLLAEMKALNEVVAGS